MPLTDVTDSYDNNLETLRQTFHFPVNKDIVFREFLTGAGKKIFLAYIDGMADGTKINDYIIRPLLLSKDTRTKGEDIIEMSSLKALTNFDEITKAVLSGDTAVYIEKTSELLLCETKGFDTRSVSTPQTEVAIKGSQEAFNESVRTNITLIRKLIKSPKLVTEFMTVGDLNNDNCAVLYLDGITNTGLIDEVKRRINGISADYVEGSGMLEQLIDNKPMSLLPTMMSTERPERAANYLNEGRVIIICDGTPFALIAPVSLSLMLESTELNTTRWQSGTFIKAVRMFAVFCATLLPGAYIALTCFHREMIPTQLLSSIIDARQNIPFSTPISVVVMWLFFELIREAGQRIPSAIGNAIGIVGGLILGQAAVEANLVSPVTLIVVAISGLSNVAIPDYDLASSLRIINLIVIILSAMMGFLGLAVAVVILISIIVNESSFGRPLLSFRSLRWATGSSLFFQRPLWKQELRTRELDTQKEESQPDISRKWTLDGGETQDE